MPSSYIGLALLCIASLLAGCSSQADSEPLTTTPSVIITPTLAPTLILPPSETSLPPLSSQLTIPPADGITSTEVNVRAGPSTASNVLGIIPADMRVEIVGKDPGEGWWQIRYPQGTEGIGWVAAQYVRTVSTPEVPTIGGAGTDPPNDTVVVILQQINIRSGPGTAFNSIGTLNPQDAVDLTAKNANGTWLQIEFGPGPEGKGWINAAFVQAISVESLPIVTEAGVIVGTGTPTSIPFTATPTMVPAREDHDSPTNPIMSVRFEPAGTHSSIYGGDVSAPQGDGQDWVQFTPYSQTVLLEISCKGNDLEIELLQNGLTMPQTETVHCGSKLVVHTEPQLPVQIHLSAGSDRSLSYTSYIVHLKTIP